MTATLSTTSIQQKYLNCRNTTITICKDLETEDYVVQPEAYVSPPKWHLGHTTWFFETFILKEYAPNYVEYDKNFGYIFNSYYEAAGERVVRTNRGNLSRPTVEEVYKYRSYVDQEIIAFLENNRINQRIEHLFEIGINHEQQHQELLYTDIKFILGNNPLLPEYKSEIKKTEETKNPKWIEFPAGVYDIGYNGNGFCYDNELQSHKVYVASFAIRSALITNQEFIEFIDSGGYSTVSLWHSEGWEWLKAEKIKHPLYWYKKEEKWWSYSLDGFKPVDPAEPVQHISYYEAAAFMEWKQWRLPTEQEWEVAADHIKWGQLWEWTESAYLPYPGFKKEEGALGEYNGKFMVNQKVLRGASFATSEGHSRKTYRNFFHTDARWQFTGMRPVISI